MARTRALLTIAFLSAFALLAAGCGSDSSVSVTESESPSSDSGSSDNDNSSDNDDSSEPSTPGEALDDALDDLGQLDDQFDQVDSVLGDEFDNCLAISRAYASLGALVLGGSAGDVEQIMSGLDGKIPSEIEDDINVVADGFAQLIEDGIFSGSEAMDTPEFEAASENIEAYVDAECSSIGE